MQASDQNRSAGFEVCSERVAGLSATADLLHGDGLPVRFQDNRDEELTRGPVDLDILLEVLRKLYLAALHLAKTGNRNRHVVGVEVDAGVRLVVLGVHAIDSSNFYLRVNTRPKKILFALNP